MFVCMFIFVSEWKKVVNRLKPFVSRSKDLFSESENKKDVNEKNDV